MNKNIQFMREQHYDSFYSWTTYFILFIVNECSFYAWSKINHVIHEQTQIIVFIHKTTHFIHEQSKSFYSWTTSSMLLLNKHIYFMHEQHEYFIHDTIDKFALTEWLIFHEQWVILLVNKTTHFISEQNGSLYVLNGTCNKSKC